jgi:hypothetical protein
VFLALSGLCRTPTAGAAPPEQCTRAFDERVHPAVDAAFDGRRPPVEPAITRLDVVEARGTAVGVHA